MKGEPTAHEGCTYPRGFLQGHLWPWPLIPARDLVSLQYGRALTASNRVPDRVPVYGTNGQCGWHNEPLANGPGIILGRKGQGPLGVEWCGTDFWVIDTAYYISLLRPDIHLPFFYHLIRYIGLNHLKDGTSNPTLSRDSFGSQLLPLPPLPEQKRIAHVLGTLDDKIDLNRRMSATLEAMSRAIFKSWFVDFDPVRQKAAGKQPVGMDAKTAALFPDSFEDSEIGEVPKGWRVEAFSQHIDADRGLSYKGEGLREPGSGMPMHNLNSIYEGGGYKHEGIKYYAGEYRDKHLISPGDVIVTNTEQGFDHLLIGHAAVVPACFGEAGLYSHHIYRVRCKSSSPLTSHYVVSLLNDPRWHYWISGFSNGTTINMLPLDALQMPLLVVPPSRLVQVFDQLTSSAHAIREANLQQSRSLAALRDALLPKLLSGEVRVPEAAEMVASAS